MKRSVSPPIAEQVHSRAQDVIRPVSSAVAMVAMVSALLTALTFLVLPALMDRPRTPERLPVAPPPASKRVSVDAPPPSPAARTALSAQQARLLEEKERARSAAHTAPVAPRPITEEAVPLFGYFMVLSSLGTAAAWWLGRQDGLLVLAPATPMIAMGVALTLTGAALLGFMTPHHLAILGIPRLVGTLGLLLALVAVPLGWLLTGAGLRPRASATRGLSLSLVVYVLAGLAWPVVAAVASGRTVSTAIEQLGRSPGVLVPSVLLWPAEAATSIGTFGQWMN